MHNTKVVDLEKLNKNCIHKFFIWSQEEGEKLNSQNWFLDFEKITKLPLTLSPSSPSLHHAYGAAPYAGAGQVAGHAPHPQPNQPPHPWVCVIAIN